MKIFIDCGYGQKGFVYEFRGDKDELISGWNNDSLPFLDRSSEKRIIKKSRKLRRLCTPSEETQARLDADAIVEIDMEGFRDRLLVGKGNKQLVVI